MNCPVDGTTLAMTSREGVEIDYCPQCRGVWLDRGELDKIIQRAAADEPMPSRSAPEPRYDDRRPQEPYDPRYDKKKKRRSLLEDLFDFD